MSFPSRHWCLVPTASLRITEDYGSSGCFFGHLQRDKAGRPRGRASKCSGKSPFRPPSMFKLEGLLENTVNLGVTEKETEVQREVTWPSSQNDLE